MSTLLPSENIETPAVSGSGDAAASGGGVVAAATANAHYHFTTADAKMEDHELESVPVTSAVFTTRQQQYERESFNKALSFYDVHCLSLSDE